MARLRRWLVTGCAFVIAGGCARDAPRAMVESVDSIFPRLGCYSFTPLPDSAYSYASDVDWPTRMRLSDGQAQPGYPYNYTAEVLDPDWNSLASPLGGGRHIGVDSILLNWGGTSFRLRVMEDGTLLGQATYEELSSVPLGHVSGEPVPCGE